MKALSQGFFVLLLKLLLWGILPSQLLAASYEGPWYDFSAYTECKADPEPPLYNGGILRSQHGNITKAYNTTKAEIHAPTFILGGLSESTRYSFSCWVQIQGANSALIRAVIATDDSKYSCVGTTMAKSGCWSFLKGGFILDSSSKTSVLLVQKTDKNMNGIKILVSSASLQPFSVEQWKMHQENNIRTKRKRVVTIHASDKLGNRLIGASISVHQLAKDFPLGSAIANTILGNLPYQAWFLERFNAAVFENELKWYTTEPQPGKLNYTLADKMLEFVRANKVVVRGHNIFWENPAVTPSWVLSLTDGNLRSAVNSRIQSLMSRYRGEFVHWDVNNEMLHFNFYEQRLGPNASLEFFNTAQQSDPLATLFMNEYNVLETCDDVNSTVDSYITRLRELKKGGAILEGIGLQGHFFTNPNLPLMRAVLDKLATLGLPIWLTEVDINQKFDHQTQAVYLEEVLREGFSYPSVNGIILWTALHSYGCYAMCLTDGDFNNLPAGEVVDRLLEEWETKETGGVTDEHGLYSFNGFLGEYKISVSYGSKSVETTFSLDRGDETMHVNVQL